MKQKLLYLLPLFLLSGCGQMCIRDRHYRYFRSEGYGGQARLYALVPYCLSALFAYRRACAELQFLQPHLPSVAEYGQSFSVLSEQIYICLRTWGLETQLHLQCRTGIYVEEQLQCFRLLFLFGRCILPGCGLGCRNECDFFPLGEFHEDACFRA